MKQNPSKMIRMLAAAYALIMLFLLFFRKSDLFILPYPDQLQEHFNPVLFRTIRLYWNCLFPPKNPSLVRLAVINLAGNILLFIPLGIFPALLWPKMCSFWKTILLATGIMCIIEFMQMLLLVGTCDIDDLILNVLGAAIGYGILYIVKRLQLS